MSHSFTKIWIHGILGTKDKQLLIKEEVENDLYKHIRNIFQQQFDTNLRAINGTKDHIHVLFLLNPKYSVKDIFHYVKGESSHWINQNDLIKDKFAWQIGYGAFSISESKVKNVEEYILKQKEHHKKKSYSEEYNNFIEKYSMQLENR